MLKRIEKVDKIFLRREFPVDFVVYTPKQIEKRKKMNDSETDALYRRRIFNENK